MSIFKLTLHMLKEKVSTKLTYIFYLHSLKIISLLLETIYVKPYFVVKWHAKSHTYNIIRMKIQLNLRLRNVGEMNGIYGSN